MSIKNELRVLRYERDMYKQEITKSTEHFEELNQRIREAERRLRASNYLPECVADDTFICLEYSIFDALWVTGACSFIRAKNLLVYLKNNNIEVKYRINYHEYKIDIEKNIIDTDFVTL